MTFFSLIDLPPNEINHGKFGLMIMDYNFHQMIFYSTQSNNSGSLTTNLHMIDLIIQGSLNTWQHAYNVSTYGYNTYFVPVMNKHVARLFEYTLQTIGSQRVCSYSEYLSDDTCVPCKKGEFSLNFNDKFCYSCSSVTSDKPIPIESLKKYQFLCNNNQSIFYSEAQFPVQALTASRESQYNTSSTSSS
mmetsp:Transcript_15301/g.11121  ORF Transcript_15301/g.11121 Transcript_15301/m.11121 type:complete len:189 (+) Transcript_15301:436-1002(+)